MKKCILLLSCAFFSLNSFGAQRTPGFFKTLCNSFTRATEVVGLKSASEAVAPKISHKPLARAHQSWTPPTHSAHYKPHTPQPAVAPSKAPLSDLAISALWHVQAKPSSTTKACRLIPFAPQTFEFEGFGIGSADAPQASVDAPKIIQTDELDSYQDQGAYPYALPEENEEDNTLPEPIEEPIHSFVDEDVITLPAIDLAEEPATPIAESPTTILFQESPATPVAESPAMAIAEIPAMAIAEIPATPVAESPAMPITQEQNAPIAQETQIQVPSLVSEQPQPLIDRAQDLLPVPLEPIIEPAQPSALEKALTTSATIALGTGSAAIIAVTTKKPQAAKKLVQRAGKVVSAIKRPTLSVLQKSAQELTAPLPKQTRYFTQTTSEEGTKIRHFNREAHFRTDIATFHAKPRLKPPVTPAQSRQTPIKSKHDAARLEGQRLEAEQNQAEEADRLKKQAVDEVAKLDAEIKAKEKAQEIADFHLKQAEEVQIREQESADAKIKDDAARLERQRLEAEQKQIELKQTEEVKAQNVPKKIKPAQSTSKYKTTQSLTTSNSFTKNPFAPTPPANPLVVKEPVTKEEAVVKEETAAEEEAVAEEKKPTKKPMQKFAPQSKNFPKTLRKKATPKVKKAAKKATQEKAKPTEELVEKEEAPQEDESFETENVSKKEPQEEDFNAEDPFKKIIPGKKPAKETFQEEEPLATDLPEINPVAPSVRAKKAIAKTVRNALAAERAAWAAPIKAEPTPPVVLHIPSTEELNEKAAHQRTVELPFGNDQPLVATKAQRSLAKTAPQSAFESAHQESGRMPLVPNADVSGFEIPLPEQTITHNEGKEIGSSYPDEFPNLAAKKESNTQVAFDFGKEIISTLVIKPLKHLAHYVIETVRNWVK